jgi:hypothetical protein
MSHRAYKKALRAAAQDNAEVRDRLIAAHHAEIERIKVKLASPPPEPMPRALRRERLGLQQKAEALARQIEELQGIQYGEALGDHAV